MTGATDSHEPRRGDGARSARLRSATGVLVGLGVTVTGCALVDNHAQLTVAMVMSDEGYDVDVTTNAVDITDDVCGDPLDCVEAFSTEEANYYRFASRDRAAEYAASLDDGFVVHYIVMDFAGKGSASTVHQRWAMERLAGTWQDHEGRFPDR